MKIYTKTGDKGLTSLIGERRVLKNDIRIEAYGTVDELNSYLGLIACLDITEADRAIIIEVQDRLFTIGACLASDSEKPNNNLPQIILTDIELLENEIDTISSFLPVLKTFILPGGSVLSSNCHIARCICRRAERKVVELANDNLVDDKIVIYLNRLSDYLFVLSKKINFNLNIAENAWIPRL